jgi:hypothetical protein
MAAQGAAAPRRGTSRGGHAGATPGRVRRARAGVEAREEGGGEEGRKMGRQGLTAVGVKANDVEGRLHRRGRGGGERERNVRGGVKEMNREVVFGVGADRWAPQGAAVAGQLPSAHVRGESGATLWVARPRAARPTQDGGGPREGKGEGGGETAVGPRTRGVLAGQQGGGGKRWEKGFFFLFNLFSKCMFHKFTQQTK